MIAHFEKSVLSGNIKAPPSKSVAHRYLISAFLLGGECCVENISLSEDIKATVNCLKSLGADIAVHDGTAVVRKGGLKNSVLDCNESGSTLRFLIPIALTMNKEFVFKGSKKLFERPLGIYEDICRENGFLFEKSEGRLKIKGRLKSGEYEIRGDISSQFITGLIFALSVTEGDSVIKIIPPFESKSYVIVTLECLKKFGVDIELDGLNVRIKGGQKYTARSITVEGDYSNAAYIDAFNESGSNVKITGLSDSVQGDRVYKEYFKKLDKFCTLDITDCPDLGPILFTVAALKQGAVFTGTRRLVIKESDRCGAMSEELAKFGICTEISDNEFTVKKSEIKPPPEILSSHNDHRILMALSVLLCLTGGGISGAEAVNKSFPEYFDKIKSLGARVKMEKEHDS